MPTPFLSSEEYDERAHQLYNEGQYDEALDVLREGLGLYPNSVELHIGVGYAHHAREEYAWARRSFEEALVLDPDHEDALAGLGETLLKFGQQEQALRSFRHTLELGYQIGFPWSLGVGINFSYTTPNILIDDGNITAPPFGLNSVITPNLFPGVSISADLGNGPGIQEVATFSVDVAGPNGKVAVSNAHGTVTGAAGGVLLRPFARLISKDGDSVTTYGEPWNMN